MSKPNSGPATIPYCPEGKPGCDCGWPYSKERPAPLPLVQPALVDWDA